MVFLLFSCIDPTGRYLECSLGGFELEVCMESLTVLVQDGWRIKSVKLIDTDKRSMILPAEAFDGQSMLNSIALLQLQ